MKKYFLVFACMMLVVQNVKAQEYFSSAKDFARLYIGAVEPQYLLSAWRDIPYYKGTTDLYEGRISYHGVVYDHVKMRFDQLEQRVVILSPVGNVFCIPEQKYIDWFEMDGQRYEHDPEDDARYAALLSDGSTNGTRLYHSVWKVVSGENANEARKYQKNLAIKEHFTIVTPDDRVYHVKSASNIAKIFPEQKKQIKQLVRQQQLSFTKNTREYSLMRVVENLPSSLLSTKEEGGRRKENSTEIQSTVHDDSYTQSISPSSLLPPPSSNKDESLLPGIPVLDNDSVAMAVAPTKTRTYIVPGVKKAKASLSDDQELDEIVVVGGRLSAVKNMMMGSEKFKPVLLKNIPSAFGESDIMKIVLTLPGVTTVGEASSGYNVRGGATDQNLILFNGGTVYNPSHLFGLFTSFNSDAVDDVELFKSSIPVEYGGRISSVLKVTSKEANMEKLTGSASIGALTSKVNIEIPIVKDHVSLLLNGRTTYSDWMLKKLPESSGYKNGTANFYDLGGALT